MTESAGTGAGSTRQTADTDLTGGPGIEQDDREQMYGGNPVPADASATADADHPGMPASGDLGEDTASGAARTSLTDEGTVDEGGGIDGGGIDGGTSTGPMDTGADQGSVVEGMGTGSDEDEPGRRRPVPPDDRVAAAVEDDAPLDDRQDGDPDRDSDTGLDPEFREPTSRR